MIGDFSLRWPAELSGSLIAKLDELSSKFAVRSLLVSSGLSGNSGGGIRTPAGENQESLPAGQGRS